MTLQQMILFALKASIVLFVFALGLKATTEDATYVIRRPSLLIRALISMDVVMPVVALILARTLNLHPAVKIALVALSVSPVPPIFPKKAAKAGGRENYSIGLLVAVALLAIVVVPFAMNIFERVVHVPLEMPFSAITSLVFSTVLAPLFAGIILRAMRPAFFEKIADPISKFATILLVVSVLPVLIVSIRTVLSLVGNGTLFAMAVFAAVGLVTGYLLGGPEPENRQVLSLASSTRHPGIAVAIAHANFPDEKMAVPAILLYFIVAAILSALMNKAQSRSRNTTHNEGKRAA